MGPRCIVFLICGYCFPCSVVKLVGESKFLLDQKHHEQHRKIHPSHFKYWDIMLSICAETDDCAGCPECSCSSGCRRKQCFLKNNNYLKKKPLKQEAAANPNASSAQNSFWSWGCQSYVLPLTMV